MQPKTRRCQRTWLLRSPSFESLKYRMPKGHYFSLNVYSYLSEAYILKGIKKDIVSN